MALLRGDKVKPEKYNSPEIPQASDWEMHALQARVGKNLKSDIWYQSEAAAAAQFNNHSYPCR